MPSAKGESRSSDPIPYSGNLRSKCFRAVSEQKTNEERESGEGYSPFDCTIKTEFFLAQILWEFASNL